MRKYLFVFGLSVVMFGAFAMNASAQVSTSNVLKKVSAVVEKLEGQGAQVLFIQIDVIKKEQLATQTYTLESGSNYAVIAVGDEERIQDIDMVVVDDSGEVVGKDADDSNLSLVKFKPRKTQSFKFGVKGYKMSRNDGFYALVVCRLD